MKLNATTLMLQNVECYKIPAVTGNVQLLIDLTVISTMSKL